MSDDDVTKKLTPTTSEVSVNWEGLKRFLGWQGSLTDLKKVKLDRPESAAVAQGAVSNR